MKKQWSKENTKHLLKVFAYSAGSAVISVIITMLADIEFPTQYAVFIPVVNSVLVAIKEYFNEQR